MAKVVEFLPSEHEAKFNPSTKQRKEALAESLLLFTHPNIRPTIFYTHIYS
jgi:hypothetical protein